MAKIIGNIFTSHIPAIGGAIAKQLQDDPYWKPFFDGFPPIRSWLAENKPDVVVVVYNDHGLNFFLDKMPTFAVGTAPKYFNSDEGWGIPTLPPFNGHEDLSWQLVEELVEHEFDITTCQEMLVDHACTLPLKLLWPELPADLKIVPVSINTVQFPVPKPSRCVDFGKAIGAAVEAMDDDLKVLVVGTGGLSHQLDGTRAGHINKEFDEKFMASMVDNPGWAAGYSAEELVELTGTQGIELLNWLVGRATIHGNAKVVYENYHVPISNTATGVMLLTPEN